MSIILLISTKLKIPLKFNLNNFLSLTIMNDRQTQLKDEIGMFEHSMKTWIEYSSHMELSFSKYKLCNTAKKYGCIEIMGPKTSNILETLIRPKNIDDNDVTYDFIKDTLEKYFHPHPDTSFYVSKFQLRSQNDSETFFKYVVALRKLMENCNFSKKNRHSKLRNQLISGSKEDLKGKFNPNSMSLSQVFEVGLLWDEETKKTASPPRKQKARKNNIPKCFRCAQAKYMHKNEPCFFEWANCSVCNIKGHVSLACKYKETICNNCNAKGHVRKLCKKPTVTPHVTPITDLLDELTIAQEDLTSI